MALTFTGDYSKTPETRTFYSRLFSPFFFFDTARMGLSRNPELRNRVGGMLKNLNSYKKGDFVALR